MKTKRYSETNNIKISQQTNNPNNKQSKKMVNMKPGNALICFFQVLEDFNCNDVKFNSGSKYLAWWKRLETDTTHTGNTQFETALRNAILHPNNNYLNAAFHRHYGSSYDEEYETSSYNFWSSTTKFIERI